MSQHVEVPWWATVAQRDPVIIGDPANDGLDAFASWFFNNVDPIGMIPAVDTVRRIGEVTSVLWFRQGQFQVQLFIAPPNFIIPEHIHPNVDSYEVYAGGNIKFTKNKEWAASEDAVNAIDFRGLSKLRGMVIRVRPNDWHGGVFGESGGVFFSIQRWMNGVQPHCVACDYTGAVVDEHHLSLVQFGDAVLKNSLSEMDAIGLTQNEEA